MTPDELDAIRERAENATRGPWFVDPPEHSRTGGFVFVGNRDDGRTHGLWEIVHLTSEKMSDLTTSAADRQRADAEFIAGARRDIPALLAYVDELRDTVELVTSTLQKTLDAAYACAGIPEDVDDPDYLFERIEAGAAALAHVRNEGSA